MKLKQSAWEKAKRVTSFFEGWIAGNFDGQYLSYGYLQWNFGQGTLQPLFKRLFDEFPQVAEATLPEGGKWLKVAIVEGWEKEWAAQIQDASCRIVDPWLTALRNLYNAPEWQQIMDDAAVEYRNYAINMCQGFGLTTDRAFALMFDIAVQNGPINPYPLAEEGYTEKLEAIVNFVTTYKTAEKWRSDVGARKLAIVYGKNMGRGWPDNVQFDDESAFEEESQTGQEAVIVTVDEAIQVLVENGIINTPEYWKSACDVVRHLDELLIKIVKRWGA